ncbi:MAG: hypothetical protein IJV97_03995, partial [Alphaproteobacteria bacterium]|nr:hypothetical protein [Alphaproteobacteria bacterium]
NAILTITQANNSEMTHIFRIMLSSSFSNYQDNIIKLKCQTFIEDGGQRKALGIRCLCPTYSDNLNKKYSGQAEV